MLKGYWLVGRHNDTVPRVRKEVGGGEKHTEGAVLLHVHPGGGCCFTNEWRQLLSLMLGGGWGWAMGRDAKKHHTPEQSGRGRKRKKFICWLSSTSCPSISWSSPQGCDGPSPLRGCLTWSLSLAEVRPYRAVFPLKWWEEPETLATWPGWQNQCVTVTAGEQSKQPV